MQRDVEPWRVDEISSGRQGCWRRKHEAEASVLEMEVHSGNGPGLGSTQGGSRGRWWGKVLVQSWTVTSAT